MRTSSAFGLAGSVAPGLRFGVRWVLHESRQSADPVHLDASPVEQVKRREQLCTRTDYEHNVARHDLGVEAG
jgi:hypothetical protein